MLPAKEDVVGRGGQQALSSNYDHHPQAPPAMTDKHWRRLRRAQLKHGQTDRLEATSAVERMQLPLQPHDRLHL